MGYISKLIDFFLNREITYEIQKQKKQIEQYKRRRKYYTLSSDFG